MNIDSINCYLNNPAYQIYCYIDKIEYIPHFKEVTKCQILYDLYNNINNFYHESTNIILINDINDIKIINKKRILLLNKTLNKITKKLLFDILKPDYFLYINCEEDYINYECFCNIIEPKFELSQLEIKCLLFNLNKFYKFTNQSFKINLPIARIDIKMINDDIESDYFYVCKENEYKSYSNDELIDCMKASFIPPIIKFITSHYISKPTEKLNTYLAQCEKKIKLDFKYF